MRTPISDMNFISKHISNNISIIAKKIIREERGYFLKLNESIVVGYNQWRIIGINQYGQPSMPHDIAVSFSLFTDKQILNVKKQIDNGEYKVFKY